MKHDEVKDLESISKITNVDRNTKTITAIKGTIIGNKRWGRLDFLCHYCGWRFYFVTADVAVNNSISRQRYTKQDKRDAKAPQLTNKKKR